LTFKKKAERTKINTLQVLQDSIRDVIDTFHFIGHLVVTLNLNKICFAVPNFFDTQSLHQIVQPFFHNNLLIIDAL
jgi:hypothetical protein